MASKEHIPWNKGLKGVQVAWNKGKPWSAEAKMKMSLAHMGGQGFTGTHTDATKMKISISKVGNSPAWNKGVKMGKNPAHSERMRGRKMLEETKRKISTAMSGERSYRWKGGVTSVDRLERVKFRIRLQKLIFERDGYKCQICNATGNLQVDHIQSWSEFKELRFDPDNCRTLCIKCHYKITFHRDMPESVRAWGHNLVRRVA